ncbi:glycosyltransferase family A protein [uncultured Jannaschia sp.]|uniref:glycosyltransferase family A protein n=1 Tax=uncultured Jannaschia sp. TaxID=293347 RepID=UPI00260B2934|nr:glycosyltransferase family A protein [uncultured Jannaschia sp.]
MTDLTVAITAHAETVVAGPSFRSLRAALAPVRERGYDVQLLLGLDSCTPACRDYMTQPDFVDFERHDYAFRDQGRTRNALIGAARGKWVAFLDADDLFSENWLIRAIEELEAAEATGRRAIVHPELNWQFDGINHVYSNPAQDHPFFSPYVLAIANYYDAMCVAPRAVWEELPFPDRAIADGFALEDYQWFVEATALGWRHVVARDTIIFKRRRDASQTHESRGTSAVIRAIEPLAIDNLEKLLPKTGTSS